MRCDPLHQPFHRHDQARLIVFVRGDYRERAIEGQSRFRPGDFIIRPAYFAHDGFGSPDAAYRTLPVSRAAWTRFHADHGWSVRTGRLPAELITDPEALMHTGDVVLSNCPTQAVEPAVDQTRLGRIARALTETTPCQTGELAEKEGLRPWQLTRRFLDRYGLTPTRFRQQARLQMALKLMAETGLSLAAIAADAGFADQSHFCRSLRAATGQSPSQTRRALLTA